MLQRYDRATAEFCILLLPPQVVAKKLLQILGYSASQSKPEVEEPFLGWGVQPRKDLAKVCTQMCPAQTIIWFVIRSLTCIVLDP